MNFKKILANFFSYLKCFIVFNYFLYLRCKNN